MSNLKVVVTKAGALYRCTVDGLPIGGKYGDSYAALKLADSIEACLKDTGRRVEYTTWMGKELMGVTHLCCGASRWLVGEELPDGYARRTHAHFSGLLDSQTGRVEVVQNGGGYWVAFDGHVIGPSNRTRFVAEKFAESLTATMNDPDRRVQHMSWYGSEGEVKQYGYTELQCKSFRCKLTQTETYPEAKASYDKMTQIFGTDAVKQAITKISEVRCENSDY